MLLWNRGKGGYNEVDERDNSRIQKEMKFGKKKVS